MATPPDDPILKDLTFNPLDSFMDTFDLGATVIQLHAQGRLDKGTISILSADPTGNVGYAVGTVMVVAGGNVKGLDGSVQGAELALSMVVHPEDAVRIGLALLKATWKVMPPTSHALVAAYQQIDDLVRKSKS